MSDPTQQNGQNFEPIPGLSYAYRGASRRIGKPPPRSLDIVPAEEYQRNKHGRFGTTNPTRDTSLFRQVMLETDATPYGAKEHFGESDYTSPGENEVWCACRLGQSTTALPDGRLIEIGGEHEDSYDPDFCIYNDVIVHKPDGSADIFGYPESVFPPTDFHSATLVGEWIYILGRLGYAKGRVPGSCPIFRLSLTDYHMEELHAGGNDPGLIYDHVAEPVDGSRIRVSSGKAIIRNPQKGRLQPFVTVPLDGEFELDLTSLMWRRL